MFVARADDPLSPRRGEMWRAAFELFDRTFDPYGVGAVLGRFLQTLNPYGVRNQLNEGLRLLSADVQPPDTSLK